MTRFVLYYRGPKGPPAEHLRRIRSTAGLRVVEEDSPRLLLVEGAEVELKKALRMLDGWSVSPERSHRAGSA